eukprot:SAG31_NODE_10020_length_1194_cov_1.830137_1_plen_175_part_00
MAVAACAKFDETVDMQIKMGLDPRRADQQIRGMAALPHNPGKFVKIAVFANAAMHLEASDAGADLVGAEDLMEKIAEGSVPVDFTLCIATPAMMPALGSKLGRLLGPKKLMPNIRVGTVTDDIVAAIEAAQKGQASYRLDKVRVVHRAYGHNKAAHLLLTLSRRVCRMPILLLA